MSLVDNFQFLSPPFYSSAPASPIHTSTTRFSFSDWNSQPLEKTLEAQEPNSRYPFESDFGLSSNEPVNVMDYPVPTLDDELFAAPSMITEFTETAAEMQSPLHLDMDTKKDEIDTVPMTRNNPSQSASVALDDVVRMGDEMTGEQVCKKKRKLDEIGDIVFCNQPQHCNDYCSHPRHTYAPTAIMLPPKKFRKEIPCSNIGIPSIPSSEPLSADLPHHYALLQPSLSSQSDSILSKEIWPSAYQPIPRLWRSDHETKDALAAPLFPTRNGEIMPIHPSLNASINTHPYPGPPLLPLCPYPHAHAQPHSYVDYPTLKQTDVFEKAKMESQLATDVENASGKTKPPGEMELFEVLASLTNFKTQNCFGCHKNVGKSLVICTKYLQCNRCYCEGCALKMNTSAKTIIKAQESIRKCVNISKDLLECGIFYCLNCR